MGGLTSPSTTFKAGMEPPAFDCTAGVTSVLVHATCIVADIEPLVLIGALAAWVLPESAWCTASVLGVFDGIDTMG